MAAALSAVTARSTVAAVSSDRLYPPYQQELLANLLPGLANLDVVQSLYGHDGFLIEVEQVSKLVADALDN
jgi:homoserine O-acetyltransferase